MGHGGPVTPDVSSRARPCPHVRTVSQTGTHGSRPDTGDRDGARAAASAKRPTATTTLRRGRSLAGTRVRDRRRPAARRLPLVHGNENHGRPIVSLAPPRARTTSRDSYASCSTRHPRSRTSSSSRCSSEAAGRQHVQCQRPRDPEVCSRPNISRTGAMTPPVATTATRRGTSTRCRGASLFRPVRSHAAGRRRGTHRDQLATPDDGGMIAATAAWNSRQRRSLSCTRLAESLRRSAA
jgi:hypothetical protein